MEQGNNQREATKTTYTDKDRERILACIDKHTTVSMRELIEEFLRAEFDSIHSRVESKHLTLDGLAKALKESGKFGKPGRHVISTIWARIVSERSQGKAKEIAGKRQVSSPSTPSADETKKGEGSNGIDKA